ncbi:deoxynucleoside triphosphate triphosphohydrolase SAMHD1-like isoform X2 [Tachysurus ichikawai]
MCHGPFSHLFDSMFIPRVRPELEREHETASVKMFDHLVKENNLEPMMKYYGLSNKDLEFIKEQIAGPLNPSAQDTWAYSGRPEEKSFLYEIVANKRTGIDVDKWDYFARDSYHLGLKNIPDYQRFLKMARVCVVNGKKIICARDKEVHDLYDMFHTRHSLHRRAYQHKVTKIIGEIITEALVKANPYILIQGSSGKKYKMSEAIDDMEAYTGSQEALAKEVAESKPDDTEVVLKAEDFIVSVFGIDYGKKEKNPIDNVYFYCKHNPTEAFQIRKEQVSKLLPDIFSEKHIRLYCKQTDKLAAAKKYFQQWCKTRDLKPLDAKLVIQEFTHAKETQNKEQGNAEPKVRVKKDLFNTRHGQQH